ncbi:MAG: hypothetical protein LBH57_07145 [Treponema sp.]|jgi:hypothetical protein|nr:hypothetical protein [Treponema sp.]
MKRFFLVCCLGIFGVFSLFAEFRIDVGLDLLFLQKPDTDADKTVLLDGFFFPVPELGLYGQLNLGNFHIGTGIRGFSYIFYNAFWPTVYGEFDLGPVTFHAQIGGGAYGIINLLGKEPATLQDTSESQDVSNVPYSMLKLNPTIIPEISAWFRFGKFFKAGAGWIAMILLNQEDSKIFNIDPRFYIAVKMTFPSAASRKNPDGTQRIF